MRVIVSCNQYGYCRGIRDITGFSDESAAFCINECLLKGWKYEIFENAKSIEEVEALTALQDNLIANDDKKKVAALAKKLNGCEYGYEGSKEIWQEAVKAGLAAVFGSNDNITKFRGAIDADIIINKDGFVYLNKQGDLVNYSHSPKCGYYGRLKKRIQSIEAVWSDMRRMWHYKTEIPHKKFNIMRGEEVFCEGIVFSMESLVCCIEKRNAEKE